MEVEGQLVCEYEVYVVEEAENPGKILALEALVFLDSFATVMYRALRVHKVCVRVRVYVYVTTCWLV